PLAEFPLEPARDASAHRTNVIPILGTVLLSLSVGTMIMLYRTLEAAEHGLWISPLPFAFLGVGLTAFHFAERCAGRWCGWIAIPNWCPARRAASRMPLRSYFGVIASRYFASLFR